MAFTNFVGRLRVPGPACRCKRTIILNKTIGPILALLYGRRRGRGWRAFAVIGSPRGARRGRVAARFAKGGELPPPPPGELSSGCVGVEGRRGGERRT
jgi:hypothetical protein